MKNILILGLALCMGVSLSSCEDNDVRPSMALTPTGTMDDSNNDINTDTTDLNTGGQFNYNSNVGPTDGEISHFKNNTWDFTDANPN